MHCASNVETAAAITQPLPPVLPHAPAAPHRHTRCRRGADTPRVQPYGLGIWVGGAGVRRGGGEASGDRTALASSRRTRLATPRYSAQAGQAMQGWNSKTKQSTSPDAYLNPVNSLCIICGSARADKMSNSSRYRRTRHTAHDTQACDPLSGSTKLLRARAACSTRAPTCGW